jgi:plastocyanin
MRKEFVICIIGSLISIDVLSGCTQQPSSGNAVTIQNYAFNPKTLTISVGGNVTWTNKDGVDHTVVSDTGVFQSGPLGNGQSYTHQFTTPGTYNYSCTIHPSMHGTIIVK